jgi:hypothetical protein
VAIDFCFYDSQRYIEITKKKKSTYWFPFFIKHLMKAASFSTFGVVASLLVQYKQTRQIEPQEIVLHFHRAAPLF